MGDFVSFEYSIKAAIEHNLQIDYELEILTYEVSSWILLVLVFGSVETNMCLYFNYILLIKTSWSTIGWGVA